MKLLSFGPKTRAFAAFLLLSAGLIAPMAANHAILDGSTHSLHTADVAQARLALLEGQFPIRVSPGQIGGLAYPLFQFEGQFPFTLAGLLHLGIFRSDPYRAYQVTIVIAWLIVALSTFASAGILFRNRRTAYLAGAFALASPYLIAATLTRGSLTEIWGFALASVLLFLTIPKPGSDRRPLLAMSLVSFLLFTTDIAFALDTIFFVAIWTVAIQDHEPEDPARFWREAIRELAVLLVPLAMGAFLAAYFIAPRFWTDSLLIDRMRESPSWSVGEIITRLLAFLGPSVKWSSSVGDEARPMVGWIAIGGVVIAAQWSSTLASRAWVESRRRVIGFLLIFSIAAMLAILPPAALRFLPSSFDPQASSWRFIAFATWSGALLAARSAEILLKGKVRRAHVIGGWILALLFVSQSIPPFKASPITVESIASGEEKNLGHTAYIRLPEMVSSQIWSGNIEIPLVNLQGWLVLEKEYRLLKSSIRGTTEPALMMKGEIPFGLGIERVNLQLFVNGKPYALVQRVEGPFEWKIPLKMDELPLEGDSWVLSFVSDRPLKGQVSPDLKPGERVGARIDHLYITDLSPTHTAIAAVQTRKDCRREKDRIACQVPTNELATAALLPALFYPGMQELKVNDREVDPVPLHHYSYTLTGFRLPSAGTARAEVRFTGLSWANQLSLAAWAVLLGWIGVEIWRRLARSRAG